MKEKRVSKIIIIPTLVLFISTFIYSTYNIVVWYIDGKNNEKMLKETQNLIFEDEIEEDIIDENTINNINLKTLKEKNNEVVGFIKVNGTNIEYSVVKHKDNSYYLTHSFDKTYNKYGWIFAHYANKFDGTDKNITLFGHNMRNGSMFGSLKNVLTPEWQLNDKNLDIIFITDEVKYFLLIKYIKKNILQPHHLKTIKNF